MTVLVAYVSRPEGKAALDKGIEMAKRFQDDLVVVNASAAAGNDDAIASESEAKQIQDQLSALGIKADFLQFARGYSPHEEILEVAKERNASLIVIGLRKRSPVGKLFLGSVAQDILLTASCPVLAVKAN